jgi:AcrR family transcriptional regulator
LFVVSINESSVGGRRGRPPDPSLEARVYAAVFEVYSEVGWAGFTVDAVAKRAKAGKMAIYKKWATKEKLIHDMFEAMIQRVVLEETGSVRTELIQMANTMLDGYFGQHGLVVLRAKVEAKVYPRLFGRVVDELQRDNMNAIWSIVERGVARGELPAGTSPALVLDAVAGILTNHVLSTPTTKMAALENHKAKYAEETVDFVLSAVGYKAKRTRR